jgi:galactitol-specific phosphotransferase system IIB component
MAVEEVPRNLKDEMAVRSFLSSLRFDSITNVKKTRISKLPANASNVDIINKINAIIESLNKN